MKLNPHVLPDYTLKLIYSTNLPPPSVAGGGPEHTSQNTISTEEKPHVTEVAGEKNVFVLGEDDNIQSSTMDEILSRHVSLHRDHHLILA